MTASVLKTLGAILKSLLNVNFIFLSVGQALISAAFVIMSSSRALFARSEWFATEERVIVLAIIDALNSFGFILGYYVPTCVVSGSQDAEEFKQ